MSVPRVPEWAYGAVLYDGLETCLIGFGTQFNRPVAIYNYNKCLAKLESDFRSECEKASACDCDHDLEAQEWMDFNVTGGWVGNHTPVFLMESSEEDEEPQGCKHCSSVGGCAC
jgi:hypothetical protein